MQVLNAVVSKGSVTAAAAALGFTPSAVSQQVAALERQAGVALLERVGRGVRPTAAGLLVARHAAAIDEEVARAEAGLDDLRAGRSGRVSLRYFSTAGAALVAPAVARFRRAHPGVHVDLELGEAGDPLGAVARGQADLALVVRDGEEAVPGVRLTHLLDDPYLAVLPAGHPLAEGAAPGLADLAGEAWIGCARPGPCADALLESCAAAGFRPEFAVESEDYATAQAFAAAGLGVAVIPALALAAPQPGVVVRRLREGEPVRAIHAATRETPNDRPALTALVHTLQATAATLS
ncbi:LysR family transcriptional regulator [Bailinhaonella thermotolerans]|uniref:LysR family transcriptional regulator n=2 Tax=Bailinhaonella thermotolerans TaxID=1070861 RepID=A0A3A4AVA5_9ACTN|nr:LysR family transcriptional regulator [Bailinhaonella thermotolerans]